MSPPWHLQSQVEAFPTFRLFCFSFDTSLYGPAIVCSDWGLVDDVVPMSFAAGTGPQRRAMLNQDTVRRKQKRCLDAVDGYGIAEEQSPIWFEVVRYQFPQPNTDSEQVCIFQHSIPDSDCLPADVRGSNSVCKHRTCGLHISLSTDLQPLTSPQYFESRRLKANLYSRSRSVSPTMPPNL